jgi:hypothetical protein
MSKIIYIVLLFALAAYGQPERIAIMNTVDTRDSIDFSDLSYLTDKLRDIAGKVLPKNRYGIMTQQSIVDRLGSMERMVKECKEMSCLSGWWSRRINDSNRIVYFKWLCFIKFYRFA